MASSFKIKPLKKQMALIEKKLNSIRVPIDRRTADSIGTVVLREMKSMILKGLSPIQGRGRFEKYKNPKKYPGKRKRPRPVNLKLTGEFLKSLTADEKSSQTGWNTEISFGNNQLSKDKEDGHRNRAGGQPSRPIIPEGNETFAVRIKRKYIKLYKERIRKLLKKRPR